MVLGITNYRECDIGNVNNIAKLFLKKFENSIVIIFHDNNYDNISEKYINYENIKVITDNKNHGTLYGRLQIIKNIPEKYNNDFLVWVDSDDTPNFDIVYNVLNTYKGADYIQWDSLFTKVVWSRLVKVKIYKMLEPKIKLYSNLRVRTAECNIITAGLISLLREYNLKFELYKGIHWITVNGENQVFNFEEDLYEDERADNLKADFEDLIQWIIWEYKENPGFDLGVKGCNHVYVDNYRRINELRMKVNKINNVIEDIIKDMPQDYKVLIEEKLKI